MRFGSLFSGIGGLDLGLERAGHECRWQVELDPYCQAVLRKHWPHVPKYPDVRTVGDELERVDLVCGGFPCQPVSLAGRRRGAADERWLWPEFARILRVLRPRYALLENVPGLLAGGGMAEVLGDLASLGFDAEWDCIPAAAVGAPHLRYRVFIVAHTQRDGLEGLIGAGAAPWATGGASALANADQFGGRSEPEPIPQRAGQPIGSGSAGALAEPRGVGCGQGPGFFGGLGLEGCSWWESEPDVGRVAHGVPSRVDRLRALGNAVVPRVAEVIGR